MKGKISIFWAKLQLKVVKLLPMVIAFMYVLNTVLIYFGLTPTFLNLLGGMSLLPLLFLYISSYAFRFCNYHRMFLHYIATSDAFNWVDNLIGIPISNYTYFITLITLFGITCFIALFMFLKEKVRL